MVSVMNEPHYHKKKKKSSHVWQILSQMTVIWYNHKVNNIQIILYRSSCSQMLYKIVGVLKGVLKNLTNFTGKHLCQVLCERKSLTFRQNLYYKRNACKQLFSCEFCRIFKKTFLLEHTRISASYLNQKSKTKQESRMAPKLGNSRFALQWSSSFDELCFSSC